MQLVTRPVSIREFAVLTAHSFNVVTFELTERYLPKAGVRNDKCITNLVSKMALKAN